MPIIQRADKEGEGNAKGCDYLCQYDGPGDSPRWSTEDRALDVTDANEVADHIHRKYGYPLVVGDNVDHKKEEILRQMKAGEISREEAVALLRSHAANVERRGGLQALPCRGLLAVWSPRDNTCFKS
jgi:hypothetical protein